MKGLLRRLHDHWFAPAPLEDLALVRIVVVSAQLILLLTPYLSDEIGACLGCSLHYQHFLTQVDQSYFAPIPTLKLLLLPFGGPGVRPDPMFLHAVWVAAVQWDPNSPREAASAATEPAEAPSVAKDRR